MKDRERGKSTREAHAMYKRSKKRGREKQGGKTKRTSENGSSRKTRSFSTSATRTENVGRVRLRAFRRKGARGCSSSSCWVGCRERSHYPGGADRRAEKGRTVMRDVGSSGEEWDRRSERRRGEGGGGGEKGGRKGTAGLEGKRKRGGSDGVNCRRQGHRLYLAGTADTCLRRYTRTVL